MRNVRKASKDNSTNRDRWCQSLGKGILLNMRQHQRMSIRPAAAVGLLLSVILPLGLLAGTSADASTTASEPAVAGASAPATAGGTGGGGRQTPRVAKQNPGTFPNNVTPTSTPSTPQSPLATPSPLHPTNPTPSAQPVPKKTASDKTAGSQLRARSSASHTVTYKDPVGGNTTIEAYRN